MMMRNNSLNETYFFIKNGIYFFPSLNHGACLNYPIKEERKRFFKFYFYFLHAFVVFFIIYFSIKIYFNPTVINRMLLGAIIDSFLFMPIFSA